MLTWNVVIENLNKPNILALSRQLGIGRSTLYRWQHIAKPVRLAPQEFAWLLENLKPDAAASLRQSLQAALGQADAQPPAAPAPSPAKQPAQAPEDYTYPNLHANGRGDLLEAPPRTSAPPKERAETRVETIMKQALAVPDIEEDDTVNLRQLERLRKVSETLSTHATQPGGYLSRNRRTPRAKEMSHLRQLEITTLLRMFEALSHDADARVSLAVLVFFAYFAMYNPTPPY